MKAHSRSMALLLAILITGSNQAARGAADSFVNFETPPVHPIALSPDGGQLAVCNLADGRLELFDVSSGTAVSVGSVPVGLDPVSVRYRTASEAWVVNHISDSISVVDVEGRRVVATIQTLDTPADVIFAGSGVCVVRDAEHGASVRSGHAPARDEPGHSSRAAQSAGRQSRRPQGVR